MGFQTAFMPRPRTNSGKPSTPVVNPHLVGRGKPVEQVSEINPIDPARKLLTPRGRANAALRSVAERHGVTPQDIISHSLKPRVVAARREAFAAVAQANKEWDFAKLGRFFDRDPWSISLSLKKWGHHE